MKIKNYFSYNDPVPNDLKSFLVYLFTCTSCSCSYIGETCYHFKTRIEDHIKKDNKSQIFQPQHSPATWFDSYNSLWFKIIDKDNTKFDFKINEALHINWRKPYLNRKKSFSSHPFTINSVLPCSILHLFVVLLFFAFLFLLLFLLFLTLIIGIFYCLNHNLLLLHLIATHLVSHLSILLFSLSLR